MTGGELPSVPRLRSRAAPRTQARPRSLNRETIVAAALAIIDREGLDALTMRTVAHSLGTGAASLYAHVGGKEELLEAVIDHVIGEIDFAVQPDPGRWAEQTKHAVRSMRDAFARHRDLARASFARIPMGENALRGIEAMISVLQAGGLPDRVVALACDLLPLYAMATAYEESIYQAHGVTEAEFDEYIAAMRDYFQALPAERFPKVAALAVALTSGDGNERFEFGLDVLVRGLAAMAT
ncbi:MAG TPA: TetR/AcrR family transcriptional regulator [Solirubrobacteraceae bacterium]|nr:TetR/AcrR family transcriptional regulator [Solirubrobacteraceae bacterium]